MNTNNAPERTQWVNELISSAKHRIQTTFDAGSLIEIADYISTLESALMQSQVSESDEAVAREIVEIFTGKYERPAYHVKEADVAAILARHRQPAAVSADAVEVATKFRPSEFIRDELKARGWTLEDLVNRMEGNAAINFLSMKMYMTVDNPNCLLGESAPLVSKAFGLSDTFYTRIEEQYLSAIRALSPESVCGGGE